MIKSMSKMLGLLSAAVLLLTWASAPAMADTSYSLTSSFAMTQGAGDGEVNDPQHVAVETSTGNILLVDRGNNRVQVFAPDGAGSATYLTQFGSGVLNAPLGIAIDQSTGDVYVSDAANVVKYTSDGAATPTYTQDNTFTSPGVTGPLAFDQTAHQLLVAATDHVRRYSTTGTAGTNFDGSGSGAAFSNLKDIAVQDDGDVVVIDGVRVLRFHSDNGFAASLTGASVEPSALTAIPGTDNLLVEQNGGYDPNFTQFLPSARLYRYSGDTLAGVTILPTNIQGTTGLAAGGDASARLYLTAGPGRWSSGDVGVESLTPFVVQAPTVSDVAAHPSEHGARLDASINPNGDQSTWTFEFGLTTAYGAQYPVTPANAGSGTDAVAVTKTIGGLQPGTLYHYRLRATNGGGLAGADHTFTTEVPSAPATADARGRAYEQITAPGGAGAVPNYLWPMPVTPDGNTVAYVTPIARPGDPTSEILEYSVARRSATGWTAMSATVPQASAMGNQGFLGLTVRAFSADLRYALAASERALTPGAAEGGSNLYIKDTMTGAVTLAYASADRALLKRFTSWTISGFPLGRILVSSDLSTVRFVANASLTPDTAPGVDNVFGLAPTGLSVVSKVGGLAPAAGATVVPGGLDQVDNVMSKDGRRLFFTVAPDSFSRGTVYLRQDGQEPTPISVSQRAGHIGEASTAIGFAGASDDGSIVYLQGSDLLTDDARPSLQGLNNILYRYDVASHELTTLTDGETETVYAIHGVSRDGSTIYFTVHGPSGDGIYVEHDGVHHYIGPMPDSYANLNISPNGRYMTYVYKSSRDPVATSGPQCVGGCSQVWRYDRDRDELACVSCTFGSAPDRAAEVATVDRLFSQHHPLTVLDDGRVYFDTPAALVPGDVNGRSDVYEWDNGERHLITPGTAAVNARITSVTPDGRSVFFTTAERLVKQDTDDFGDLYVAREGGGIAAQQVGDQAGAQSCKLEDCQGGSQRTPLTPLPGSDAVSDDGESAPVVRAAFSGGLPTAAQAAALAAGRTVPIKVKVNRPGKVSLKATVARRGGRQTLLAVTTQAHSAQTVSLRLKLSPAALRTVRSARTLSATFTVRFEGARAAKTKTLSLRRTVSSTSKGR